MYSSYCRTMSSLPKALLVTAAWDADLQSLSDDPVIPFRIRLLLVCTKQRMCNAAE